MSAQYSTDEQFAGLIQAATAAADAQERNVSVLGKRARDPDDSMIDTQLRNPANNTTQILGQLQQPITPILQNSASVLFREISEKSKKYSRPPLGKVYLDLQIAPEIFLRLQNAAKSYMLDEDHLERRNVVGHKKNSSNNDVAKLRLWGCVEDFLNTDNNGEVYFGHSAGTGIPNAPTRTIFWPEDGQKIIKFCMPLFRKMVTNERQRIYASETRKQESSKIEKGKKSDPASPLPVEEANYSPPSPLPGTDTALEVTSETDHALLEPHVEHAAYTSLSEQERNSAAIISQMTVHVNIGLLENGTFQRLTPRFSLASSAVLSLEALLTEARKHYDIGDTIMPLSEEDWFLPVIKVSLPDGLVRIKNDEAWHFALFSAGIVEWMDFEVKTLIEVANMTAVATE